MDELSREAQHATEMLVGLTVRAVKRHRPAEVLIEFADGSRLFIDAKGSLELSITPGSVD